MKKTGILFILFFAFILSACGKNAQNQQTDTEDVVNTEVEKVTEEKEEPSVTYQTIDLSSGISLGCALDSYDDRAYDPDWSDEAGMYETLWGSSLITQLDVDLIRDTGFSTVRIPVTYMNHIDENGIISQAWLARIKELVDMVIGNGMYCVIDLHHDTGENGWLFAEEENYERSSQALCMIWSQIADYFADYDQKLIFEGYNEILNGELKWNYAGVQSYEVANKLNQDFVDTIRSTGGKNATRFLLVNTYAASAEEDVIRNFVIPEDGENAHLIVGVHCYFGTNRVEEIMNRLNDYFVSNGIPIIVGEFGKINDNNSQSRIDYIQGYMSEAQKYGISCFWWDDGGNFSSPQKVDNFAILDRKHHTWYFPEIAELLVKGKEHIGKDDISEKE